MTKKKVDEVFFLLFCEKNSDGTKHLRLRGKELFQRMGRRLNAGDMHLLVDVLIKYPEITSLDLAYNDLEDEGLEILAEKYFSKENNLTYISLLHCDVHAAGLKSLSSAKYLGLRTIRLLGNKLGAKGAEHIGSLIRNCPTLENLDIGETDQILESIEPLLMIVEKSGIKSINISRIIADSYYSKVNSSSLASDLGVLLMLKETLEVLRVQKCRFDGHDVGLLLAGLKSHHHLLMLDLSANKIADHGAELLAVWLKTRPALIALCISANAIGNLGAQALALTLPFSRIRWLDLHENKIGDIALSNVLDTIRKSVRMRVLYLWGNQVGEISLDKIERMLKSGTLEQEHIDIKIDYVDGKRYAAYYSTNHYRQQVYSVQEYGWVPELRIVRNKVPHPRAQPRALFDLEFIDRYPPIDETLGLKFPWDGDEKPDYLNKSEKCNKFSIK